MPKTPLKEITRKRLEKRAVLLCCISIVLVLSLSNVHSTGNERSFLRKQLGNIVSSIVTDSFFDLSGKKERDIEIREGELPKGQEASKLYRDDMS